MPLTLVTGTPISGIISCLLCVMSTAPCRIAYLGIRVKLCIMPSMLAYTWTPLLRRCFTTHQGQPFVLGVLDSCESERTLSYRHQPLLTFITDACIIADMC